MLLSGWKTIRKKKQFATRTLYYIFQKNNWFNLQRSTPLMCVCIWVCVCVFMVNIDLSRRLISFLIYQRVLNIYSKNKISIIFKTEAVLFHWNLCISVLIVPSYWEDNRQEGQGSPNGGNRLQVLDIFISLKRQEETN